MTAKRQQLRSKDLETATGAARRLQRAFDDVNDRISALPSTSIVPVEFTTASPVPDTWPVGMPDLGPRPVVGMVPVQCEDLSTSPPGLASCGTCGWSRKSDGQYQFVLDSSGGSNLLGGRKYRVTFQVIYG